MLDRRRPIAGTRQISVLTVGRVLAAGISALWFVVAARSMSVNSFGSLALLLSIGMVTAFVTDLGLAGLLSHVVGDEPRTARAAVRQVLVRRITLAVFAGAITAVAYEIGGGEGGWVLALLFLPSLLATACHGTFTTALRSMGHVGYDAANEVLSRIGVLAVGAALLAAGRGLVGVVLVYVAADVVSAVVLVFVFGTKARGCDMELPGGALSLRAARGLGVTGVVNTLYFRVDLWLVSLFRGDRTVGRYAVAYRLFEGLLLPATSVAALSIPQTASLSGKRLQAELRRLAKRSVMLTAPLAVVGFLFGTQIVLLLFGAKYLAAVPAFRLLSIGALCTSVSAVVLPPLAIRSNRVAVAMALTLTVNVAGNCVVIPRIGAVGAAATTLVCELALVAWVLRILFVEDSSLMSGSVDPNVLLTAETASFEVERL